MSSQSQSWASWLLDSYASSVHPPPESQTTDPNGEGGDADELTESPTSTTTSHPRSSSSSNSTMPSPNSSSLPYGPYSKSGRGGAGNFTWQSDLLSSPTEVDLEAQQRQSSLSERQRAAALAEHLETTSALQTKSLRRKKAEFLRVGIGGAGNLALTQSNDIQSPKSPSFITSIGVVGGGYGRGGAGNFAAVAESERVVAGERSEEERVKAEATRLRIEAEVDGLVKVPEGALVTRGRSRDG